MKFITRSLLALIVAGIALVLGSAVFFHGWVVPNINELRPRIEKELSMQLGMDVRIASIDAHSSGLLPSFAITGVQILDAASKPILTFDRIQVEVSPQSMLTLDIDHIVLDRPKVKVTRDVSGHIEIAGIKLESQTSPSKSLDWVFSQKKISIQRAALEWQDAASNLSGMLDDVNITLQNGLRSHAIDLDAKPTQLFGRAVHFKGRFTQPLFDNHAGHWQAWTGNVEAEARKVEEVADAIQLRADWPLKNLHLEGQHVQLASAQQLLRKLSINIPHELAIVATTQLRLPKVSIQATDVSSDQFRIKFKSSLSNPYLDGTVNGNWRKADQTIEVMAQFKQMNLAEIHRYVPDQTPGNIKQLLQNARLTGQMQNVQARYGGPIQKIDLTNGLELQGSVVGADFLLPSKAAESSTPWTRWQSAGFSFRFKDSRLELRNIDAELAGLYAKGSMIIQNIQKPILEIDAKLSGGLAKVLDVLKTAPLNEVTKNFFRDSTATGQSAVALQLMLPLDKSEQNKISGHIDLIGNDFSYTSNLPPLTALTGRIRFSHEGFELVNLHSRLLGGEIRFSGDGQKIIGSGTISSDDLAAIPSLQNANAIISHLVGHMPYQFAYESKLGTSSLVIESSLQGMKIDLPAPFTKRANETWPLKLIQTKTAQNQDRIRFQLANLINTELLREITLSEGREQTKVLQGDFALGTGLAPRLPEKGVSAHIKLDQLDMDTWRTLLPSLNLRSTRTNSDSSSYIPGFIWAEVGAFRAGERNFDNLVLSANQVRDAWQINAKSNDFSGYAEVRYSGAANAGQIYARLNRLSIPDANSKIKVEQFLENAPPSTLPAIDLVVEDFELQGKKLGRLEVNAVNQLAKGFLGSGVAQEWRVQKLNITNPESELKATGVWTPAEGGRARRVDLQFEFQVANSGALLARFGQAGALKDGKGSLIGRIAWVGSPLALHYPTLTGQIKLDVSKGQFLKIEPGSASRFMSVLSLQALPKLLKLDFRDIFSDGFAFDSIAGDAQIIEGVLSSQNLQMKSVLALVSLDGNVNLDKETQNLHALILPDIDAGGASLVATLINPLIGAATYLTQLILRRPAVAAATREFVIEGSWKEPQIRQIKK